MHVILSLFITLSLTIPLATSACLYHLINQIPSSRGGHSSTFNITPNRPLQAVQPKIMVIWLAGPDHCSITLRSQSIKSTQFFSQAMFPASYTWPDRFTTQMEDLLFVPFKFPMTISSLSRSLWIPSSCYREFLILQHYVRGKHHIWVSLFSLRSLRNK